MILNVTGPFIAEVAIGAALWSAGCVGVGIFAATETRPRHRKRTPVGWSVARRISQVRAPH